MDTGLERAAAALRDAKHLVVFTGAGISAESGVPTFRDDEGFWRRFPMDRFGTWRGLTDVALREPRLLAEYVGAVLTPIAKADPNAAHNAIARAAGQVERLTVVTQNIDALHQRAGAPAVLEVHGTLLAKCGLQGGDRGQLGHADLRRVSRRVEAARRGPLALVRLLLALRPLLGVGWRGVYRPAVVMFGDALAEPAWSLAREAVLHCDCLLQIGTSGAVMPAAQLPFDAAAAGATTIAVDPEETLADIWLEGTACDVVPRLFDEAFGTGTAVA